MGRVKRKCWNQICITLKNRLNDLFARDVVYDSMAPWDSNCSTTATGKCNEMRPIVLFASCHPSRLDFVIFFSRMVRGCRCQLRGSKHVRRHAFHSPRPATQRSAGSMPGSVMGVNPIGNVAQSQYYVCPLPAMERHSRETTCSAGLPRRSSRIPRDSFTSQLYTDSSCCGPPCSFSLRGIRGLRELWILCVTRFIWRHNFGYLFPFRSHSRIVADVNRVFPDQFFDNRYNLQHPSHPDIT